METLAMPEGPAERRGALRYCVAMDGQVMELLTRSRMTVRCSDLSLSGCYLDTLNPLEPGTPLIVRLEHGGRGFEVQARVAYMAPRMGMGVEFAQPIPEDESPVLQAWIEELKAAARPAASTFGAGMTR
jgi:PilZ domain-containing protein